MREREETRDSFIGRQEEKKPEEEALGNEKGGGREGDVISHI